VDLRKVMEEYYLFMKVEKTASVKTIYAYRSDLNQLADFLEKEGLNPFTVDAISQPLIHKFLLYLGENFDYKPATLSRRVNCLRSFFNFCVEQDYIMVSPMRKIKPPRIPRRIPVFLKPAELKRLLGVPEFFKADDMWLQDKAMLYVLAYTGVRRAELLSLSWDNIDFNNQTLTVIGKGDLERLLPLKDELTEILWGYLQTRLPLTNRSLLINEKQNRMDKDTLARRFRRCVIKAQLDPEKITPHVMRHTFATNLLNKGVDLVTIQELLGHLDPGSTLVYTHTNVQNKKEAIRKMDI